MALRKKIRSSRLLKYKSFKRKARRWSGKIDDHFFFKEKIKAGEKKNSFFSGFVKLGLDRLLPCLTTLNEKPGDSVKCKGHLAFLNAESDDSSIKKKVSFSRCFPEAGIYGFFIGSFRCFFRLCVNFSIFLKKGLHLKKESGILSK